MGRTIVRVSSMLLVSFAVSLQAQQPAAWKDTSPHTTQFVTVEKDVQLEVLDWGGTGRPLVLLAGLGNTAHVFDDFAPKLTSQAHVYGITRRGFGASSAPDSGYSGDRLGDDVVAVITALHLEKPVLAGHSAAGEELSSVGTRYPERIAGLIYLDAIFPYTYYSPSRGDLAIDLLALQKKLGLWLTPMKLPEREQYASDLLETDLPQLEKDLQRWQKDVEIKTPTPPAPRKPTDTDMASFPAYQAWTARTEGFTFPEAELRQSYEVRPDGSVGKRRDYQNASIAMMHGVQKYSDLKVPVLAICAVPHNLASTYHNDEAARTAAEALDAAQNEPVIEAFQTSVPSAHVVRLARASHYVFLSNEQDVLREIEAFLNGLPR